MELQMIFSIIAVVLIVILIGVSVWSNRREKSRVFSNTFSTRPQTAKVSSDSFDNTPPPVNTTSQPEISATEIQQQVNEQVNGIKIRVPGGYQPEQPAVSQTPFGEQPQPFSAEPQPAPFNYTNYAEQQTAQEAEQPFNQSSVLNKTVEQLEAEAASEQGEVDLYSDEVRQELAQQSNNHTQPEPSTQKLMTLYVVAPQGQVFQGNAIVQALDTLGLQFGEHQIFHRHLDNPNSPVIFSVANMMQPGNFDPNHIDQLETQGVVMFMYLPSAGNDLVNLRMMIKSAESLAQYLGGFVMTEQFELFDESARHRYLLEVQKA